MENGISLARRRVQGFLQVLVLGLKVFFFVVRFLKVEVF